MTAWLSYHLLSASLAPAEHDPARLFAWTVETAVRGFVPHAAYAALADRAAARGLPMAHVEARMAGLLALDANPVAALMAGSGSQQALVRRWNGFNHQAPLGVHTLMTGPAGAPLQRSARHAGAHSALRQGVTAACVQQLSRAVDRPAHEARHAPPLLARLAALHAGGGGLHDCTEHLHAQPAATLAECAQALGMSARTLQRMLEARGLRFTRLRQAVRITLAGQALRTGSGTLTGVALDAGFFDAAHFAHAWKQACGLSPSQYRQLALLH